ncbi:MAG: hypothetical protein RLZZ15_592 [Verrucomicrobiota bacterium]|jgi:hypothetical protein
MPPLVLAQLLGQVATLGLPLIEKLVADFEAGRAATTVTAADLAEVRRLAALTAEAIAQREGVAIPR